MNAVAHQYANRKEAFPNDELVFESHFTNGSPCVMARYEAPVLRFSESTPLELVRESIARWNTAMQESFSGTGYYGHSPMDEMATPGYHVLVLFADQCFFDSFMGCVEDITLTEPEAQLCAMEEAVIEEISYEGIALPWAS